MKGIKYEIYTTDEHLISEYSGLNFFQIGELDYLDFLILRRDAHINALSQTESGREYLEKAYYFEQTKPDRESLRRKFGK